MMMTCRYDGGVAAVTETTGPNHLPSVCEALPPHLHHVHIGQMRYKTQDTYFVTVKLYANTEMPSMCECSITEVLSRAKTNVIWCIR